MSAAPSPRAELGIGTATFLPGYGLAKSGRPNTTLLRRVLDAGVRYIDTAYGYGESEQALGAFAEQIRNRQVRVCTKIAADVLTPEAFETVLRWSLARLQCATVDTVLLHSIGAAALEQPAVAGVWQRVRALGLVRRTGASTYGVKDACTAAAAAWCDTLQVEYSILNQSVVRALASQRRTGLEVVVRSVLCKGLLTGTASQVVLPEPAADAIGHLSELASQWDMSLATLAIRFALDTPGVDVVLVGVTEPAELDEAIQASRRLPLTRAQWEAVAAFDRSGEDWSHPERWAADGRLVS